MNVISTLVLMLSLAVVPLTGPQSEQLGTATDRGPLLDEAALYPLLDNALTWTPGDESGAMIPDLNAIEKTPEAHRGQLFLLEGDFAGRPLLEGQNHDKLARPGAWSGKMQQWVLVTDRKADRVVVVYLVNPSTTLENAPRPGARVRAIGRFYKVWRDVDRANNPTDYLVFVGNSATVAPHTGLGTVSSGPMLPIAGGILLLGIVFMFVRARKISVKAKPLGTRVRREERVQAEKAGVIEEVEPDPTLPKDPTAALEELERRKKMVDGGGGADSR